MTVDLKRCFRSDIKRSLRNEQLLQGVVTRSPLLCPGAQMVLAMKLISLAFDLDSGSVRDCPGLFHYGGYLFHVGSVLFGPWISFHDYMSAINQPSENIFVSLFCVTVLFAPFYDCNSTQFNITSL